MQWASASNIDGGVTIDLSALDGVMVGTDAEMGKLVTLGAGYVYCSSVVPLLMSLLFLSYFVL